MVFIHPQNKSLVPGKIWKLKHCIYDLLDEHCIYDLLDEHCIYDLLDEHCIYDLLDEHCIYDLLDEPTNWYKKMKHELVDTL